MSIRTQHTPIARSDYRCSFCYKTISKGTRHRLIEWQSEGELFTKRMHAWCGGWWWWIEQRRPKRSRKKRKS